MLYEVNAYSLFSFPLCRMFAVFIDVSVGNKNKDSCVGYNMPKINHLFTDLTHLKERNVEDLSGGELQRFACAVVCIQKADMYV